MLSLSIIPAPGHEQESHAIGAPIMCDTKSHPLSGAVKGSTQARVHCLVPPRTGVTGNGGVRELERKAEGAGSHPLTQARDKPDG